VRFDGLARRSFVLVQALSPQERDRLRDVGKRFIQATSVVSGLAGLLNVNWWISVPGTLIAASTIAIFSFRGPRRKAHLVVRQQPFRLLGSAPSSWARC
jgi:hypothetical protein